MTLKENRLFEKGELTLSDLQNKAREEIPQIMREIVAKYSWGTCICGKKIEIGEKITRHPYFGYWWHSSCVELDMSKDKAPSKSEAMINSLIKKTRDNDTVWRDDLLDLAKNAFLGKWSVDWWTEDAIITFWILDFFGIHRLTKGWRTQTEKGREKYAQKIELEFSRHKGWICKRCKHLIWVEKSVERGIGPTCYKHELEKEQRV